MFMARFPTTDVCSVAAPPLSPLTSLLNSLEVSSVAFIIDSPSRVAETHQRRVGQISIVDTHIIDAHRVPPVMDIRGRSCHLQSPAEFLDLCVLEACNGDSGTNSPQR